MGSEAIASHTKSGQIDTSMQLPRVLSVDVAALGWLSMICEGSAVRPAKAALAPRENEILSLEAR